MQKKRERRLTYGEATGTTVTGTQEKNLNRIKNENRLNLIDTSQMTLNPF